jgi:hypothetical protein
MQLDDAGIQLGGEGWHSGDLVGRHGHDHVVGLEPPVARRDHEPVPGFREPVDPDAIANRQLEAGRVGLEVVGHLVLGWKGVGHSWEGHPR